MRILLLTPDWPSASLWHHAGHIPSLALRTLAALTPPEHEVRVLDGNVSTVPFDEPWDLVGISLLTPLAPRGYAIADGFRRRGVPVVLGGIHPSCLPEEAAAHADSVAVGEADGLWADILGDAEGRSLRRVYRAAAPPPDWGSSRWRREPPPVIREPYLIQTSRGCPNDCSFCTVPAFFGRRSRLRPVPEILAELEAAQPGLIFFVDDNFLADRRHALSLLTGLRGPRLGKTRWMSQATIAAADDEGFLELAQGSGCVGLFIGFESISPGSLRELGKGFLDPSLFRARIARLHDRGIGILGSFIIGTDSDTRESFPRTLDFAREARLDAALFLAPTPLPGTRLARGLEAAGRILTRDWARYDMLHAVFRPAHMSPEDLEEGILRIHRDFYSRPSIRQRLDPSRHPGIIAPLNQSLRGAWSRLEALRYP